MLEIALVIILIFTAIFSIIFSMNVFILPFVSGVPYVPLRKKQLEKIFKDIKFAKELKIVDLGCGDGRVLRHLEKKGYKNLYGYEINPWPYMLGKIKNIFSGSKVKVYYKNFEKINLNQFDIAFCYLLDSYLIKLKGKFKRELKPGAKIISYGFQIKEWIPTDIIYTNSENKKIGRIYIYQIKKYEKNC